MLLLAPNLWFSMWQLLIGETPETEQVRNSPGNAVETRTASCGLPLDSSRVKFKLLQMAFYLGTTWPTTAFQLVSPPPHPPPCPTASFWPNAKNH